MANIKEMLEKEKMDFAAALEGKFEVEGEVLVLARREAVFVKDAIDSIDYVMAILDGGVQLPKTDEDVNSPLGQVYGYMRGSILNIVMAEAIVYGQWSNVGELYYDTCDDEDRCETKGTVVENPNEGESLWCKLKRSVAGAFGGAEKKAKTERPKSTQNGKVTQTPQRKYDGTDETLFFTDFDDFDDDDTT